MIIQNSRKQCKKIQKLSKKKYIYIYIEMHRRKFLHNDERFDASFDSFMTNASF